jgi:cobalt-zinc-cadmium efflux system outer membrane protein
MMKSPLPHLFLTFLVAGCVSVPRDESVSAVRAGASERIGSPVALRGDDGADSSVREMLAGEIDAERAVRIALLNNPRVDALLAEMDLARAEVLEGSTIANPIFEAEIRFPGDPYRPYELRLAQSILDLIQLPRRRAAARAAFDAARMRVTADVVGFAADVRDDYYALVAATSNLALTETMTEASQLAVELALRQHAAGNITDLDLEREQARWEDAKLELAAEQERVLLQREAFIRRLGLDGSAEWRIASSFPSLPETEIEGEALETILAERRLDLAAARRELDAARRLLPASRLEGIGEAVVDVHREREPDGSRTTGPGIEFPIPIFNRGAAARLRAEARIAQLEAEIATGASAAASEVRSARERLLAARARAAYYRDVIVPRRERILRLTQLEYNAMFVGIYELLEAKENQMRAQRDYNEALRAYWSTRGDFERAIHGTGSPDVRVGAAESRRRGMETRGDEH